MYALGATLYTMLTGSLPFSARSAIQIIKKKGAERIHPRHSAGPSAASTNRPSDPPRHEPRSGQAIASCAAFIKDLTGKDLPVIAPKREPTAARRVVAPARPQPASASVPTLQPATSPTPAAATTGSQDHTWWQLLIAFGLALGSALAMTYYLQAFHH